MTSLHVECNGICCSNESTDTAGVGMYQLQWPPQSHAKSGLLLIEIGSVRASGTFENDDPSCSQRILCRDTPVENGQGPICPRRIGNPRIEVQHGICGNTIPLCMFSEVSRVSGSCHEVFIVAYVVHCCGATVHPVALLATYSAVHQKSRVEASSSIDNWRGQGGRAVL